MIIPKRNNHRTRYLKSGLNIIKFCYSRKYEIQLWTFGCFAGSMNFLKKRIERKMKKTVETRLNRRIPGLWAKKSSLIRKYSEMIRKNSRNIKNKNFFIIKGRLQMAAVSPELLFTGLCNEHLVFGCDHSIHQ